MSYSFVTVTTPVPTCSPFSNDVCSICKSSCIDCDGLHFEYFIGSTITIISSLTVIISYLFTPKLRYHPSVYIFYRSIIDLLLGFCLASYYISDKMRKTNDISHFSCDNTFCGNIGYLSSFLLLCSIGYFMALLYDLYSTVKNPFSSPYTYNIIKTNCVIVLISLITSSIVRFSKEFAYRADVQFCAIQKSNNDNGHWSISIDTAIIFYGPIVFANIFGIFVTVSTYIRLRKGTPNTSSIREKTIRDVWSYCIITTVYNAIFAMFYILTWTQNNGSDYYYTSDQNPIFHKCFALTLSLFGFTDFIVFVIVNYKIYFNKNSNNNIINENNKNGEFENEMRMDSIDAGKSLKRPLLPNQIQYALDQTAVDADADADIDVLGTPSLKNFQINSKRYLNINNSIWKRLCKNFGVSVIPNDNQETINKALRKEILAYTTDGIIQSVERVKNECMNNDSYPATMYDFVDNKINKFKLQIIHNSSVILKEQHHRIKVRCCMISSNSSALSFNDDDNLINVDAKSDYNDRQSLSFASDSRYETQRHFVDYAPLIFKDIRKRLKITDSQYSKSMVPNDKNKQLEVLRKVKCGEGKSGAFFYITHDSKYVVKTIKKHEVSFFINILCDYKKHLDTNPDTIISRMIGLHSIIIYGLTKYFIVMQNVFVAQLKPTEVYDLKGSWVGRYTKHQKKDDSNSKTMKDLDLKRHVILTHSEREDIIEQLQRDTQFLCDHNIMDYSLLLGIYYMKIKKKERDCDLDKYSEKKEEKRNINDIYFGGIRSDIICGPGIYYFGIIDTLQPYSIRKNIERLFKIYIQRLDRKGISCAKPEEYRDRFMLHMKNVIISSNKYVPHLDPNKCPTEEFFVYTSSKDVNKNAIKRKESNKQQKHKHKPKYKFRKITQ